MWMVETIGEGHRTRDPFYEVLVVILLLPPIEFVVIRVIDVYGVGVEDGRHVPLFSFAFIWEPVFRW